MIEKKRVEFIDNTDMLDAVVTHKLDNLEYVSMMLSNNFRTSYRDMCMGLAITLVYDTIK